MLKPLLSALGLLSLFMHPASAEQVALKPQAEAMVKALGKASCPLLHREQRSDGFKTEQIAFSHRGRFDQTARAFTLFRIPCWLGAYNQGDAYVLFDSYGEGKIVPFAIPQYDVAYVGEGFETVRSITLRGYTAKWSVVLSRFDEKALEISEFNKSRGLGDAYTTGVWRFENGNFNLKTYSVDAAFDGRADAKPVVNFEASK